MMLLILLNCIHTKLWHLWTVLKERTATDFCIAWGLKCIYCLQYTLCIFFSHFEKFDTSSCLQHQCDFAFLTEMLKWLTAVQESHREIMWNGKWLSSIRQEDALSLAKFLQGILKVWMVCLSAQAVVWRLQSSPLTWKSHAPSFEGDLAYECV